MIVHTADIQDRDAARGLLASVCNLVPWLRHVFADGGYAGDKLKGAIEDLGEWMIEIIKRSNTAKGFRSDDIPCRCEVPPTPARRNRLAEEVLRLYDYRDTMDTRAAINALTSIVSEPGVALAPEPPSFGQRSSRRTPSAFCRKLDIRLEMDPRAWSGGGLYLLASVLEQFFALNATVNSFSRTRVVLRGGSETVASWPARSGTREVG